MAEANRSKQMYKVRPYFVIKKVKLPDCMYLMRPLYKLPSVAGDDNGDQEVTKAALSYLEGKQEKLTSQIKLLKGKVEDIAKKAGLEINELQHLVENHGSSLPMDVVISSSPSAPPYFLLSLCDYISQTTTCCLKSYVHSSASGTLDKSIQSTFNRTAPRNKRVQLRITVIWKSNNVCPYPSMVLTPQRHTVVQGSANICRFLCRIYCPNLYEGLGAETACKIDNWLDLASLSFTCGNAKEKASVLRQMNSCLGNSSFLVDNKGLLTAADLLLFSVIAPQEGLKCANNVKNWMKCCKDIPFLKSIPCLYASDR